MPRDNTRFVVVRAAELSVAIGRVAQFADERSGAVRIKMEMQNELKITAQSNESGESEDSIETPYTSDPLVAVGFNSSYTLDFLKALSNEGEVRLESQRRSIRRPDAPRRPRRRIQNRTSLMPMRASEARSTFLIEGSLLKGKVPGIHRACAFLASIKKSCHPEQSVVKVEGSALSLSFAGITPN